MHFKRFLFLITLLFFNHLCQAQSDAPRNRHFFRTNITQFVMRDFGLEYEFASKAGVGITVGFSHKLGNDRTVSDINFFYSNNHLHYLSGFANTFTIGPNFILKNKEHYHFYINPVFFYRYMWYDHLLATKDNYDSNYRVDQSMRGEVYGTKCLVGFRWIFATSDKFAITLDMVTGISLRSKQLLVTEYGSDIGQAKGQTKPLPLPIENEVRYIAPAPQFGLKLGVAF